MSNSVTLTLPDDISAHAEAIAKKTDQSIEQVLLTLLQSLTAQQPVLPPDQQRELDALRHLSDEVLWAIARDQLSDSMQTRAQHLMAKNNLEHLTDAEHQELDDLVSRADHLMVLKAEAAAILRQRGHDFNQEDFSSKDG